jgi:hypothetical protein
VLSGFEAVQGPAHEVLSGFPRQANGARWEAELVQEGDIFAAVSHHAHIVRCIGRTRIAGGFALALELADGDLHARIAAGCAQGLKPLLSACHNSQPCCLHACLHGGQSQRWAACGMPCSGAA